MIHFNCDEFIQDVLDDCSIIMNINSKDVFLLNSTSNFIFKNLVEQEDIRSIINKYIEQYEPSVEYNVVYDDFIEIKNELFEKGILYED